MATMLNKTNGMYVPPDVLQLGAEIPCLEIPYQNKHLARNGRGRAPTVNRHNGNTWNIGHGPKMSYRENERSHNVVVNSPNHSNQGSHHLRDDLNSRFRGQDTHDMINEHRAKQEHNMENEPLCFHQGLEKIQDNLVHQQIVNLHKQKEWLRETMTLEMWQLGTYWRRPSLHSVKTLEQHLCLLVLNFLTSNMMEWETLQSTWRLIKVG